MKKHLLEKAIDVIRAKADNPKEDYTLAHAVLEVIAAWRADDDIGPLEGACQSLELLEELAKREVGM